MSMDELQPLHCDIHDNEEPASAVCLTHHNLLCLSCLLDKSRSSQGCIIKPVDKIDDDKTWAVVEYLRIKQSLCKKKQQLTENEKKVTDLRDGLNNEIMEMFERLKRHLEELKNKTFISLESKTSHILDKINTKRANVTTLESDVNLHLAKLKTDEDIDIAECKAKLITITPKVIKNLREELAIPFGKFKHNKDLEKALLKFGNGLGDIQLVDKNETEYLETFTSYLQCQEQPQEKGNEHNHQDVSDDRCHGDTQASPSSQKSTEPKSVKDSLKSTEEQNGTPVPPATSVMLQNKTPTLTDQDKSKTSSDSTETTSSDEPILTKETKHPTTCTKHHGLKFHFGLPKIFSKERKAHHHSDAAGKNKEIGGSESPLHVSEITTRKELGLEGYKDELDVPKNINPKQLINTAITVNGLKATDTESIWKFSKVVFLGESHIGLFSETNSAVVVLALDGSVKCQKAFSDKIAGIAATSRNQLAVLLRERPEIRQLVLTDEGLQKKSSLYHREVIVNITGFDYDEQQSHFAISSPRKLIILDAEGNNVKTVSIAISEYSDVVTLYNFKENCIYILEIEHHTLKCFSYATSSVVWAHKVEKQEFSPRNMAFYSNKLYVTSKNYIAVFTATDGALVNTVTTSGLLEDCLGVCAFEDVIVCSSNSDDYQKALSIAFVAM